VLTGHQTTNAQLPDAADEIRIVGQVIRKKSRWLGAAEEEENVDVVELDSRRKDESEIGIVMPSIEPAGGGADGESHRRPE
jgi:hypothetical protein